MSIHRSGVLAALMLGASLLPFHSLLAEIVQMRSGKTIIGQIVSQDRETLSILTGGEQVKVRKSDVARIQYPAGKSEEEKARIEALKRENELWLKELEQDLKRRAAEEDAEENQETSRRKEESSFFRDEIIEEKKRRRKNAFWRSLVLPGWGQFYKEESSKGWIVAGAVPLALGTAYYSRQAYLAASSHYNSSNTVFAAVLYQHHSIPFAFMNYSQTSADKSAMVQNQGRLAAAFGLGLAVYLYSVADSLLKEPHLNWEDEFTDRGPVNQIEIPPVVAMDPPVAPAQIPYEIAYTWRF